ncbi:unnamed protein product [Clonostachys rosea]|uniref:NmrA-like domain-containing protein n=1 Tax=Bionectria ochroleuca TaxID=29856 RepID=A0ABY6U884_BIOOC|nr:unnamed protein product [Clonostachys rosea]
MPLNIAILGAEQPAGHSVTIVQRKDSTKPTPSGVKARKLDLSNFEELTTAFKGQDVVVSAVPFPTLATDKVIIDAAVAASVKRIVPSEFTTNLDTPLSRKLPHVRGKVEIREYLESSFSATSLTTWTSINNGAFFEMSLKYGVLGPNLQQRKATFHNGGSNVVGASLLSDIGKVLVKVLEPAHFQETANKAVYFYSAAVSERLLTDLAGQVTGIDFGSVNDGQIQDLNVDDMIREADKKLAEGDMSALATYYYPMMYSNGYGGMDFKELSWNERLGLKTMNEDDLK